MNLKEKTKYFLHGISYIGERFYRIGEEISKLFSWFYLTNYELKKHQSKSLEDSFREDGEAFRRDAEALNGDREIVRRDLENVMKR